MKGSFRAVLFDIDGTLISLDPIMEAAKATCRAFGFRELSTEEVMENIVSKAFAREFTNLFPESRRHKRDVEQFFVAISSENQKHYGGLFKTVRPTFAALHKRGMRIALVTTKHRYSVRKFLGHFRLHPDALVCFEDVRHIKPSPEPVRKALKKLGVRPEEVLFVGDHPYDIIAGKRAGVTPAGVLTGYGDRRSLKRAGARFLLNDLSEVLQLVK
ncbi:HAD-IA family hydrolase [Candidatus Micrarchaeota archaeon]|nr:HAD-IA family hydrolase [Candidatus Micrarchaeota archaeon]